MTCSCTSVRWSPLVSPAWQRVRRFRSKAERRALKTCGSEKAKAATGLRNGDGFLRQLRARHSGAVDIKPAEP